MKASKLTPMTTTEQKNAASKFADQWAERGSERSDCQAFWLSLLRDVYGVEHPEEIIEFEKPVQVNSTKFIDAYISSTRVLIEQKGRHVNLQQAAKQSDGELLTPFGQAKRYADEMDYDERPRWIITSNFKSFFIHDMNAQHSEPEEVLLKNLPTEYYRLQFIADKNNVHIHREIEVSKEAGRLIGEIYDALLPCYHDQKSSETLRSLNVLCVRIVFCLYAEDAGLFGRHGIFHDYLVQFDHQHMRLGLIELFKTLNTPTDDRDPYIDDTLSAFPYVNGGLFAIDDIEIPRFTPQLADLLINRAADNFDWSAISPTIFGAIFESTLNPDTRRSGGMHYTSIENIHKVIDPLFLNDLRYDFDSICKITQERTRNTALKNYIDRLSHLKFLDPACGSGNFLTETYLSLRRLENEALRILKGNASTEINFGDDFSPIKVSINQFYGIEINDFAVTVAKTALWISEAQMMAETSDILSEPLTYLPLKSYDNIIEGDALTTDWDKFPHQETITDIYARKTYIVSAGQPVSLDKEPTAHYGNIALHTEGISFNAAPELVETESVSFDYIIGNPPFVGGMLRADEQRKSLQCAFPQCKKIGEVDYVAGWYAKATRLMTGTNTRCAFVSTNSICQGQSVEAVWRPLMEMGAHIDFAYKTFVWNSESYQKAKVHCVIIGFSCSKNNKRPLIFDGENTTEANHINAYLFDADDIFIESQASPICDVPPMHFGSMPRDGGGFTLTPDERDAIIAKEPQAEKFIHRYIGAEELINNRLRYCIWLYGAPLAEWSRCREIGRRVTAVREFRLASKAAATRRFADAPALFCQIAQPDTDYLIVPSVSSEKRHYVPIDFMTKDVIASNAVQIIPDASLYHFGILTSSVHMAWMRVVCGRLKSDYRYSKDIVYNCFVWPEPTDTQRQKIETTAQAILDARTAEQGASLATLYNDATMPPALRRAHRANDMAVLAAYGLDPQASDTEIAMHIMSLYNQKTKNSNNK